VTRKEHKIQIFKDGVRWVAVELEGTVSFSKDGTTLGEARWVNDQFHDNTAILPDAVYLELEEKIRKAIADDYFD